MDKQKLIQRLRREILKKWEDLYFLILRKKNKSLLRTRSNQMKDRLKMGDVRWILENLKIQFVWNLGRILDRWLSSDDEVWAVWMQLTDGTVRRRSITQLFSLESELVRWTRR